MAVSGRIAFLPWVTIPVPITVGGFRFVPSRLDDLEIFDPEIRDVASQAIRTHVDQSGSPIQSCTLIVRCRAKPSWDISDDVWDKARRASELISICALSEQEFLRGHFASYMNSSMFRPVNMRVTSGSTDIGLYYRRRGGSLRVGGRKFYKTIFQQPDQVEGTRCDNINEKLAKALWKSRSKAPDLWRSVGLSLPLFLLANSDSPELDDERCLMLSAIAFERLLRPQHSTAQGMASKFDDFWKLFPHKSIGRARRVRPDPAKWGKEQSKWPIRRKWMKELYETRSSQAHYGKKNDFSSNWTPFKHMVIAAFAYPLTLKIALSNENLYKFDCRERVCCDVFDELLDCDWGNGVERPPEWPSIIDLEYASREISAVVESAWKKAHSA